MTPLARHAMLRMRPQAASPINSLPGRARAPGFATRGCGRDGNTARRLN
jgi:hypothetical protein